jgi:hypothetical protein
MSSDPASATASGQSAPDHAARYEALRAYAVERYAPSSRDGLVVLIREGVAAWMEAWSRLPTPPPPPMQAERQRPLALPDDASADVVRVLAAMTLSHIQEVHT